MRTLRSIADALDISVETLFEQAGLIPESAKTEAQATEAALRADTRLTESQKRALLSVYRSYVETNTDET